MKVDLSAEIFDRDGGRIYVPNTEPIPPADRHKVTPERYDKEPVQITAAKAICFALDQNPNRDKPLGLREMYDRVELADRILRQIAAGAALCRAAEAPTADDPVPWEQLEDVAHRLIALGVRQQERELLAREHASMQRTYMEARRDELRHYVELAVRTIEPLYQALGRDGQLI